MLSKDNAVCNPTRASASRHSCVRAAGLATKFKIGKSGLAQLDKIASSSRCLANTGSRTSTTYSPA